MLVVALTGFGGKATGLVNFEYTATGVNMIIHDPLAEAIIRPMTDEISILRRALRRAVIYGTSNNKQIENKKVSDELKEWILKGMNVKNFPKLPTEVGPKSANCRGGI